MGQYCWAYHSWEYRQMITPWPRKRDVHMMMFQMGPFLWSCKMKLNITAARMKVLETMKARIVNGFFFSISFQTLLVWFLTSKAHEEAEEHRVEEAKADCQNVLMDHRWYCKHKQHGCWFETLLRHLERTQQKEKTQSELSKTGSAFVISFSPSDDHLPRESPDTCSSTASRGPRHSMCGSSWQKMLNSTNPVRKKNNGRCKTKRKDI